MCDLKHDLQLVHMTLEPHHNEYVINLKEVG